MHQWAILVRLLYDVKVTLFDVWDNRQLEPLQQHFRCLEEQAAFEVMEEKLNLDATQSRRLRGLLGEISKASSFDDLYALLNFRYVIEPSGSLHMLKDNSFDCIFSMNVLEHIERDILEQTIRDYYRLLRPGGHSVHRIDMGDHLAYYDQRVSLKNYLRYSDRIWRAFFENTVQYVNRVQRSEWLNLFACAGFTLEEETCLHSISVDSMKIDKKYRDLDKKDLECLALHVVHTRSH